MNLTDLSLSGEVGPPTRLGLVGTARPMERVLGWISQQFGSQHFKLVVLLKPFLRPFLLRLRLFFPAERGHGHWGMSLPPKGAQSLLRELECGKVTKMDRSRD